MSGSAAERIVRAFSAFAYEGMYGAFGDTVIERDGRAVVVRSAERYRQTFGD